MRIGSGVVSTASIVASRSAAGIVVAICTATGVVIVVAVRATAGIVIVGRTVPGVAATNSPAAGIVIRAVGVVPSMRIVPAASWSASIVIGTTVGVVSSAIRTVSSVLVIRAVIRMPRPSAGPAIRVPLLLPWRLLLMLLWLRVLLWCRMRRRSSVLCRRSIFMLVPAKRWNG